MSKEENRKKEFVETLNVMTIDEDVYPEIKVIKEKAFPFSMALRILLNETEEGRELKSNREKGNISAEEIKEGVFELAKKYRHLIVYYDYEQ